MKKILRSIVLLTVAVPASLFAQQSPAVAPPVIVVSGDANIEANPDAAIIQLGVTRQAATAQGAQDQANMAASEILSAIGKLGVPSQQIQTSRLTLSPIYAPRRPDSNEAPKIAAYNASNIISINMDNLTRIGPVIDAGLKAGANQLEGVQFRLKNDLPARVQALKQAVTEAHAKAEAIAEAMGVRLGAVLEASESGVSVVPRSDAGGIMFARAAEMAPTPVSPGQLDVRANVMIRYRIEGR